MMSRPERKRLKSSRLTAYCAMTLALSLIVAYVEAIMPLQALVPVPGVKLGLANIVIVLAVLLVGYIPAFIVMVLRCVISALLFGSVTTLAFSLGGGLLAFCVSSLLIRLFFGRGLTLVGVSVAGAAAHNIGQILAAALFVYDTAIFYYLPFLIFAAVVTGCITGAAMHIVYTKLLKSQKALPGLDFKQR